MTSRPKAGECIVFSHANGFPAGTYRVLFKVWRRAGYRVLALDKLGHDPRFPVSSNWPRLRDQLIQFIETEAPGQPVHLVGHSLGGYVSLLVASRRPELARSVVLLDSPVLAGWRAHSLRMIKLSGLIARVSPAKVSHKRRTHWPSSAAALRHFAAKSAFARWDPRVLRDYISSGFEAHPQGGVQLSFRREIETHIYNSLPHHFPALLQRHAPRCPVSYIGGTQSQEGRQVGMAATRALTRGDIRWVEGTHLYPMEKPQDTARLVLQIIDERRAEVLHGPAQ